MCFLIEFFLIELSVPIEQRSWTLIVKFGQTFCELQAFPGCRRQTWTLWSFQSQNDRFQICQKFLNQHTFLFSGLCMQHASKNKSRIDNNSISRLEQQLYIQTTKHIKTTTLLAESQSAAVSASLSTHSEMKRNI